MKKGMAKQLLLLEREWKLRSRLPPFLREGWGGYNYLHSNRLDIPYYFVGKHPEPFVKKLAPAYLSPADKGSVAQNKKEAYRGKNILWWVK